MQTLGLFPSFQYSDDPAENPLLNSHVIYPDGMHQTTTQPLGPWAGSRGAGLGRLRGLRGTSSIGSAISGLGTLLVLGLASYGGYTIYKHRKAK